MRQLECQSVSQSVRNKKSQDMTGHGWLGGRYSRVVVNDGT